MAGEEKGTMNTHPTIPVDRERFRAWADRVCGAWPSELQIMASRAADGEISIAEFIAAYEKEVVTCR